MKSEKLFLVSLLKEGRLGLIVSPTYACSLYITKDQQAKLDKLKLPGLEWPTVYLNENDRNSVAKFEQIIKTKSVDLSDIILECLESKGGN